MEFLHAGFKKPEVLDSDKFKGVKFQFPKDYSFAKTLDAIPLGFKEILPATMYYPVFFAKHEDYILPFAVLGVNRRNVFVREDGTWKTKIIPSLIEVYPFGFSKKGEDYIVLIDAALKSEDGIALFDELGNETEDMKKYKEKLTYVAKDLEDALKFAKSIQELGLFTSINLEASTALGEVKVKNLISVDVAKFSSISPEKLWYLNTNGYLTILIAHYLSLRNFKLLEVWAEKD